MVVLRFRGDAVRRDCCDLARMRRLWGPVIARRISHRLQQLEAMMTLADLSFLPFDTCEHDDGIIEVPVAEHLALFIEQGPEVSDEETTMPTIVITALRERSTVATAS